MEASVAALARAGCMKFGVDSGAAVTVVGKDVAPDYPSRKGAARVLWAANGAAIPEYGHKRLVVRGDWGCGIVRASTAGVSKNLLSVSQLVDAGNEVVFRPQGAYIHHLRTGRHMPLARTNGVFELAVDLEPFSGLGPTMRRAVVGGQPGHGGPPEITDKGKACTGEVAAGIGAAFDAGLR